MQPKTSFWKRLCAGVSAIALMLSAAANLCIPACAAGQTATVTSVTSASGSATYVPGLGSCRYFTIMLNGSPALCADHGLHCSAVTNNVYTCISQDAPGYVKRALNYHEEHSGSQMDYVLAQGYIWCFQAGITEEYAQASVLADLLSGWYGSTVSDAAAMQMADRIDAMNESGTFYTWSNGNSAYQRLYSKEAGSSVLPAQPTFDSVTASASSSDSVHLHIDKTDADDGRAVPDTVYEIYRDGNLVQTATTDADGNIEYRKQHHLSDRPRHLARRDGFDNRMAGKRSFCAFKIVEA